MTDFLSPHKTNKTPRFEESQGFYTSIFFSQYLIQHFQV